MICAHLARECEHVQEKTSQSVREGQTAVGDDVGQPGGAQAKGNKTGLET